MRNEKCFGKNSSSSVFFSSTFNFLSDEFILLFDPLPTRFFLSSLSSCTIYPAAPAHPPPPFSTIAPQKWHSWWSSGVCPPSPFSFSSFSFFSSFCFP